ncbi:hypothetical protein BRADI_1g68165v3 [Brachypodium distachyon]|uniref:Uncharacterized protein n=1 Tax=Brachypodium distachyon TaxID=15368 RepID=A0A0Q3KDR9_BRADI|nr:hypothetical protein BRADI_1g68165v3 [Brachypodium distachyon]
MLVFFLYQWPNHCWGSLGINWDLTLTLGERLFAAQAAWQRGLFWETFTLAAWAIWKVRNAKLFDNAAPTLSAWRAYLRADLELLAFRSTKETFKFKLHQILQCFFS